jgi:uncharacterized protein
VKRLLLAILLAPIRAYRRWISPGLPARCRYYPTCSSYAEQALGELGPVRGTIVAGWRLLRCNPWSPGGFDELEDRTLFRNHAHDRGSSGPPGRVLAAGTPGAEGEEVAG